MNRWEIILAESEVAECAARMSAIANVKGGASTDSYTGVNVEHGDFVGECGELAFKKWCDEFGIRYIWDHRIDSADETDFKVWLDHGPSISIDIKNSHHERAAFLMIPHAQFHRHRHDAYVGCTGYESGKQIVIVIHGIVSRRVVEARGVVRDLKCLTVQYPLNLLTRMDPRMFQMTTDLQQQEKL